MPYVGRELVKGQNRELDDISSSFNSGNTAFTMQVGGVTTTAASVNQVFISLGGVMQHPGTDYTVSSSTLTFTTAPASGLAFWGLIQGNQVDTGTPSDGTVGSSKFASGDLTFPSDITIPDKIIHTGDTNTAIRFPATDTITFETAGEERVRITSGGDVNVTKPGSAANAKLEITQSGGGGGTSEILFSDTSSGRGRIFYNHGSNPEVLNLEAAGTIGLSVSTTGNIGIGTTDPDDYYSPDLVVKPAASGGITIHTPSSNTGYVMFADGTTGTDRYAGYIGYSHSSDNLILRGSGNGSKGLDIESGGNLKINDGDLAIGTAGHGIDFSAQTATSKSGSTTTSELLDHYEEGTWTPSVASTEHDASSVGSYTRTGRVVHVWMYVLMKTNSDGSAMIVTGLPFTSLASASNLGGSISVTNLGSACTIFVNNNDDSVYLRDFSNSGISQATFSGKFFYAEASYQVA